MLAEIDAKLMQQLIEKMKEIQIDIKTNIAHEKRNVSLVHSKSQ